MYFIFLSNISNSTPASFHSLSSESTLYTSICAFNFSFSTTKFVVSFHSIRTVCSPFSLYSFFVLFSISVGLPVLILSSSINPSASVTTLYFFPLGYTKSNSIPPSVNSCSSLSTLIILKLPFLCIFFNVMLDVLFHSNSSVTGVGSKIYSSCVTTSVKVNTCGYRFFNSISPKLFVV